MGSNRCKSLGLSEHNGHILFGKRKRLANKRLPILTKAFCDGGDVWVRMHGRFFVIWQRGGVPFGVGGEIWKRWSGLTATAESLNATPAQTHRCTHALLILNLQRNKFFFLISVPCELSLYSEGWKQLCLWAVVSFPKKIFQCMSTHAQQQRANPHSQ